MMLIVIVALLGFVLFGIQAFEIDQILRRMDRLIDRFDWLDDLDPGDYVRVDYKEEDE